MRMFVSRVLLVLSAYLAFCGPAFGLEPAGRDYNAPAYQMPLTTNKDLFILPPEKRFSPSISQLFYEMAYDLMHRQDLTDSQAEQAIVLLNAAMELDASASYVTADLLTIASRPGPARHLQMLYDALIKYVDKNADSQVAAKAIRYLLEQLDSRRQREILLSRLMKDIGESNLSIKSDLATELGLLFVERGDDSNGVKAMAMAYNWNNYNRLAFEKLIELVPEQITPVLNLQYLRFKLRENPLELNSALAFAQYAQRVQLYDVAVGSYEYSADLFRFLYPGQNVPIAIYREWMSSCYNTQRGQPKCLQLAEQLRKQGRFDLQIEALAAKAAAKTGDADMAGQILDSAEQKALLLAGQTDSAVDYKSLAWFYCFIKLNPERAIDFGNKAYSAEPNSPLAAGLLACAFAINKEPNLAKPLIENYPHSQVAVFAQALLQLAADEKQAAVDSLRNTIDMSPGSIISEQAHLLLTQQNAEYVPIFDTGLMLATLNQTVGQQVAPQFVNPERMLSFQLNLHGNRFSYGNDLSGAVSITNNWYEPLVISENGLCKGRIIIDANVTGDLHAQFNMFVSVTTRPSLPLEPGRSVVVPVRLDSPPLKMLLLYHPQASLNVQFTAFLDPVVTNQGNMICGIPGVKPSTVQIERPRVEISPEYLQNRINSLSKGNQGPKIKAAQLFAGLLMEIREMENRPFDSAPPTTTFEGRQDREPAYKFVHPNWMAPMLKSALVQSLGDSDWVVRVNSIAAIADLPLDYELINAASKGLNDQHWPARMTAIALLAQKQDYNFSKVLDHVAEYDDNQFVRNMAFALGAKAPEPNQPVEQPFFNLLKKEPNDANALPFNSGK
jgi:hypothetical protein